MSNTVDREHSSFPETSDSKVWRVGRTALQPIQLLKKKQTSLVGISEPTEASPSALFSPSCSPCEPPRTNLFSPPFLARLPKVQVPVPPHRLLPALGHQSHRCSVPERRLALTGVAVGDVGDGGSSAHAWNWAAGGNLRQRTKVGPLLPGVKH